jgi:hypothetical protein
VNIADSQRKRESTLTVLGALCAWRVESRATSPAATVQLLNDASSHYAPRIHHELPPRHPQRPPPAD